MSTILEQVSEILVSSFDVEADALREESSLEFLGLDSLSQAELGEVLGARFGVKIDDDEFATVSSVSEIVGMLRAKGAVG